MAKRRLNSAKIAKQPALKKKIANFVAEASVHYNTSDYNLVEMLYRGHRGFISFDEKELSNIFEKLYARVSKDYAERKKEAEEHKNGRRWHVGASTDELLKRLTEDGTKIMDDLMDEILLT